MHKVSRLLPVVLVIVFVGCQGSPERARSEMQSVYRAAKALDEQLKAGVEMGELHKLQGHLAAELAIIHDRMERDPSTNTLLSASYAGYQATLESYSLVLDILDYHRTKELCIAPRYEAAEKSDWKEMSLPEKMADLEANAKFINRILKCNKQNEDLDRSLHQRADVLGMKCPKFEWDSGCLVKYAETSLRTAESLLLGIRVRSEKRQP